ncbi:hypothetical protein GEMRC1_010764 [Eukaryota sp. GEM-RC1]
MVNVQNANVGPVFLTYNPKSEIDEIIADTVQKEPVADCPGPDNSHHKVWVINDDEIVTRLQDLFNEVDAFYVADGHHRAKSAYRVGKERYEAAVAAGETVTGEEPFNYFLSVVFPSNQLKIVDYNRVLKDMNGLDDGEFFMKMMPLVHVTGESEEPIRPSKLHEFSVHWNGIWMKMEFKEEVLENLPADDPVAHLDAQILSEHILGPIFGIDDLRTSDRIDFVGGIRGLGELKKRCDDDCVLAFALHPVSVDELMAVADAGMLMPPKSTWFTPKLASGLVIRLIE